MWAGAAKLKSQEDGPTDLLAPLLPAAVGNDGRVDEGALGRHILTQQALHFLRPEAGREVQQLHMPVVSNGTEMRHLPCQPGFNRNTTRQSVSGGQCVPQQPTEGKKSLRFSRTARMLHAGPGPSRDGAVTLQLEGLVETRTALHSTVCRGPVPGRPQTWASCPWGAVSPQTAGRTRAAPLRFPLLPALSFLPSSHTANGKAAPTAQPPGPTCEGQQHRCFI